MKSPWIIALCFSGLAAAAWGQAAPAAAPASQQGAASPQGAAPAPAPATMSVPMPGAAPAGSSAPSGSQGGGFLGNDAPVFNPATEIFTWDGHNWHATDNRLFQARLEKYLNAPEEATADDKNYRAILAAILNDLAPENATTAHVDDAFRLLAKASDYDIDARLCDSIGDDVYSAWAALNSSERMARANESLEQERQKIEWNTQVTAQSSNLDQPPADSKNAAASAQWSQQQASRRTMEMQPLTTRLAEVMTTIKANQAKKELSLIEAKIEFQTLMVQLFMERRFQHVLICTRFYRAIFSGGDTRLQVGKDTKDLFSNTTGMPPTVGTLDSLANEALRDVREGVQAFEFLLSQHEMESASKRLAEAFAVGEYLPEIRTLPRSEKRQALQFQQKCDQLISSLEVKDYTLAQKLVDELSKSATDFDSSKATAAIETAKQISALHLAKARNAAVSGDKTTLEDELKAATEIWPRNPELAQVSSLIFSQSDVQQKALVDLDQLISQHNYRQIYNDKMRFIAAAAMYPDKQAALAKVLDQMQTIESAIVQAQEIEKRGDSPGAWEALQKVAEEFPDDSKVSQLRADLTTEAAEFVRTLRTAQDMEHKNEVGSSLAWYLKAQKLYPTSEYAGEGIQRLVKKILPQGSSDS